MNLKEVVNNFLNAQVLVLNLTDTSPKIEFRLTEIEFYLYSVTHPDPYTHRAEEQKYKNRFYFHKFSNGTFKSGTWKGLDICLGNGDSYFGALIRSITDIGTGRTIEGPCLTVNRILDHFGSGNVRDVIDQDVQTEEEVSAGHVEVLAAQASPSFSQFWNKSETSNILSLSKK